MNLETAENIQCEFEYLVLDSYFPIHFASHGQRYQDWQFAVEFICRLLICKLAVLEPVNFETEKEIFTFCYGLSKQNPFVEMNELWYYGELVLTNKGLLLVKKYIPEAFDIWNEEEFKLNIHFIEELEAIFIDYGVKWNEVNPLFPISYL